LEFSASVGIIHKESVTVVSYRPRFEPNTSHMQVKNVAVYKTCSIPFLSSVTDPTQTYQLIASLNNTLQKYDWWLN